jgi:hypothetical protein
MRCKEILDDGTQCNIVSTKYTQINSTVSWGQYQMCNKCCHRLHPEAYSKYRSVSHYIRELRQEDPELDKYMSSNVTTTKWEPWK